MVKVWFTRRRGTPLILKGPVTSRRPDGSCLRKTTRLPLKRPARRMRTVPGVMDSLSLAGLATLRRAKGTGMSSDA